MIDYETAIDASLYPQDIPSPARAVPPAARARR